jgi:glycosyltransferase involved in cell wall biosynthesis
MDVTLITPRLPLPFFASDSRWFHVLASQLPRCDVNLSLVAIHEGANGAAVQEAKTHAETFGYDLRVIQPRLPSRPLDRARRLWRPRTELTQDPAVREAFESLRSERSQIITSNLAAPGLPRYLGDIAAEVHYLYSIDQAGEVPHTPIEKFRRLQGRRAEREFLCGPDRLIVNSPRMADLVSTSRAVDAITRLTLDPSLYPFHGSHEEPVVGFIGSMFWEPSLRAAERLLLHIWPLLRQQCPKARLLVAGWQAQERLGHHFPIEGAELVGTVQRATDFFQRLAVLLFPPTGGTGVKIKTLEAMAFGVPVVTTAEGVEGLEGVSGAPRPVEDDDRSLAAAAAALLDDPGQRRDLAVGGRGAFDQELNPKTAALAFITAASKGVGR